ncbi:MAG: hypothetical protein IH796_03935 [Deltaproteobacteria bacterium]|nr:hypothetical protein [Deltaproteobacteria bacterium]
MFPCGRHTGLLLLENHYFPSCYRKFPSSAEFPVRSQTVWGRYGNVSSERPRFRHPERLRDCPCLSFSACPKRNHFGQCHQSPGHPEYRLTPGVETTTGPLGQGFANAVGMAIAQDYLASMFNKDDAAILDHYIYGICSDGDMMEGLSHEAASLAGHLKLGKIIFFYDDNGITIDGRTSLAFSEDVGKRFEGYGWQVLST